MLIKTVIAGTLVGSMTAQGAHVPAVPQCFPVGVEKICAQKSPDEQHIESELSSTAVYAYQTSSFAYQMGAFQGGPFDLQSV